MEGGTACADFPRGVEFRGSLAPFFFSTSLNKKKDIISPLPGCSKRKSGKSISVEEQQIILNVPKYFQEESKSGNKPQFRAGAVIAKTAATTGVSKIL